MNPILLEIGPIIIRWYGVMISIACLIAILHAIKEAKRKGFAKDKILDFSIYAIIGAIVGARLYYVTFTDLSGFLEDPVSIFKVWQGGLAIHGGIIGGLLVSIIYTRKQKIPFLKFADTLAPSLILGQAIGRIGCLLNGDAHGYPTKMPWGLIYSPESPAGQMFPDQPLHPTQFYEMIFNILILLILLKLRKILKTDGYLFLTYVILYSMIRIFVEHFRADRLVYFGNISAAQSISVVGIALSIAILLISTKNLNK